MPGWKRPLTCTDNAAPGMTPGAVLVCGSGDLRRLRRVVGTNRSCPEYNNNDPRCVEVATNVPGKVAIRNSETGGTVEFTAIE